jgi:hypothetical protein
MLLCYYYCIPFAKFLYFASSGILFVMALFMLKRGMYLHRAKLRQNAFILMFACAFKALLIDLRFGKEYLCRHVNLGAGSCNAKNMMMTDFIGMGLFVVASYVIYLYWRHYMPDRKREPLTPEKVHLRFWANLSLWTLIFMMCWLAAPWVGFLTVGHVPQVFLMVKWQVFAAVNLFLLIFGFWKSESCVWHFEAGKKKRARHLQETWTPRDTLWLNVFLYLLALALAYIANDVLTMHDQVQIQG